MTTVVLTPRQQEISVSIQNQRLPNSFRNDTNGSVPSTSQWWSVGKYTIPPAQAGGETTHCLVAYDKTTQKVHGVFPIAEIGRSVPVKIPSIEDGTDFETALRYCLGTSWSVQHIAWDRYSAVASFPTDMQGLYVSLERQFEGMPSSAKSVPYAWAWHQDSYEHQHGDGLSRSDFDIVKMPPQGAIAAIEKRIGISTVARMDINLTIQGMEAKKETGKGVKISPNTQGDNCSCILWSILLYTLGILPGVIYSLYRNIPTIQTERTIHKGNGLQVLVNDPVNQNIIYTTTASAQLSQSASWLMAEASFVNQAYTNRGNRTPCWTLPHAAP